MATCGAGEALSLRLRQDSSNRDAIGARVWLQLPDGRVLLREVLAGSEGLASGGPPVLHFGLGDAEGGTLRVRWPDGAWSDLGSVAAGRSLLVRRME